MKRIACLGVALALFATPALAGPNPTSSQVAETCHSWGGARSLIGASGYVGAAAWIMLFDSYSSPPAGAVTPVAWAYAPQAGSWSIWYGPDPSSAKFFNGVTVCASSTGPLTYTAYSTNTVFSAQVQ